eukprot:m.1060515 g.1060515  ORF g.1060515 m.1060515 type:complete len:251 (-) comp24209_c0_seq88:3480-4232(-)
MRLCCTMCRCHFKCTAATGFAKEVRNYAVNLFKKRDIDVRTGVSVTAVSHGLGGDGTQATDAHLSDGSVLPIGAMVWSAGVGPVRFTTGLAPQVEIGPGGRMVVDEFLNVRRKGDTAAYPDVWAIGDCAVNPAVPLPLAAKVAQQHAQYLAKAFNTDKNGSGCRPVQPFHFLDLGSMVQLGMADAALDLSHTGAVDNRDNSWLARLLPRAVRGTVAWLAWRSYYVGNQVRSLMRHNRAQRSSGLKRLDLL